MTVAELIKQLKKMPAQAKIGINHGDNREYEVAGWVCSVQHHIKSEYQSEVDNIIRKEDREGYKGHPEEWVTLHC